MIQGRALASDNLFAESSATPQRLALPTWAVEGLRQLPTVRAVLQPHLRTSSSASFLASLEDKDSATQTRHPTTATPAPLISAVRLACRVSAMVPDTVDELLERYLALLDEYTTARDALSKLQAGIFHDLARANFTAERGFRYGQDSYDDRMQATRRVDVSSSGAGPPSFAVHQVGLDAAAEASKSKDTPAVGDESTEQREPRPRPADPLRWFGVLTPMPLRAAQTQAVEAVEDVIPKLASLSAEMADIEIQVGRARKKRAKAEAAAKKEADPGTRKEAAAV